MTLANDDGLACLSIGSGLAKQEKTWTASGSRGTPKILGKLCILELFLTRNRQKFHFSIFPIILQLDVKHHHE